VNQRTRAKRILISALLAFSTAAAQTPAADPGWPRQYSDGTARLVLFQPEVDDWPDFKKLTARFAFELKPSKTSQAAYGTLFMEADTRVDFGSRVVAFANFGVSDIRFPSVRNDAETQSLAMLLKKLLPATPTAVDLNRVLAYMDKSRFNPRQTAVSLEPPQILVSRQAAVLVIIDGDPITVDVEKTDLQKVVNTNWDLLFDKKSKQYYLRDDKVWLSAKELDGAWLPVKQLPKDFSKLPETDPYLEIRQAAASPQQPAVFKLVLLVHKPTELIVLRGEPSLEPITGTALMWVTNTECDLFFDTKGNAFYFLTSGRWFRARELRSNEWTAGTTSLPDDFAKIPPDHPRAHVLAAVAGTRQAEEAVLAASIPQTAVVDRKSIRAQVEYAGEPKFESITGTGVSYATNTPNDVLQVDNAYYLCLDGVWLVGSTAKGPWAAADHIPEEIYAIPPESPKYNVTYVTVYESEPDTVTYGYTAGYTGVYVGFGVAMWGTGYYYAPYYAWGVYPYPVYWPAAYYTYGVSAWYNAAVGTYARGSAVYGPYGGYGREAAYNPSTGAYTWGRKAWGPYGAAASGGFYNPSTGTWGGGYRASNGYQSWGQSVVGRGDQWARTGSVSGSRGAVGGVETSAGGKAVAARGSQGQGFVARSSAGDVYAGRDGNVYKRDQAGNWYRNNGGSWDDVSRPTRSADGSLRAETLQGLNRDASARNRGNFNAARDQSARQGSGWTSGGFVGNRSSGWAIRSPGFGRR
jgi:hypothetical protein